MLEGPDMICLKYSIPVFLFTYTASYVYVLSRPILSLVEISAFYVSVSIITAATIFLARTMKNGYHNTLNTVELSAASISGAGFSLPLAFMGLLLVGISRGEYTGVKKWLPEFVDAEAEIQRLVAELELSQETREKSMQILEQARDQGLMKGRSAETMAAAIIISRLERKTSREHWTKLRL